MKVSYSASVVLNSSHAHSSLYVYTVLIPMHELISMQKAASRHRGIFIVATKAYSGASRNPKCHKLLSLGIRDTYMRSKSVQSQSKGRQWQPPI